MENIRIGKQSRIPAQIEHVKELEQRVVVDPEHALVVETLLLGIVVERGF